MAGCPNCSDLAIQPIAFGEFREPAWTAVGWKNEEDYAHDQEIDFCPFCGFALLPSTAAESLESSERSK